jgi:hypothetical protein
MRFEDFHKREVGWNRHWWKWVVLVVLLFLGYWSFGFLSMRETEIEQNPAAVTRRDVRLESVKNLCQNLPVPESFIWEKETVTEHNDDLTVFAETYQSNRTSTEVIPFFQVWFSSNGWIKSDTQKGSTTSAVVITFHKGNQEISIFSSDFTGFHDIQCQEREVKKL